MGIDAFIDEIKSRLDIVEVVSGYVQLKRVGRNYQGLCPFHIEKTPSFTVSPDKQIFYCFGCGVGGDVIKFIQLIEGIEFWEALETAAQMAGVSMEEIKPEEGKSLKERERLRELHELLANSFSSILKSSAGEPARQYLKGRGISPLWWDVFRIGYLPADFDVASLCLKRGFTRQELTSTGIFYPSNGRLVCRLKERVIIPICDHNAKAVAFGARVIEKGEPKYLNSPETSIFQKGKLLFGLHLAREHIRKKGRAVLVEGYMDVIAMHVAGFQEAVASLGTAFTKHQAQRLSRIAREVVILYDGDEAGRRASMKAAGAFYAVGLEPKIALLPEGLDPDDFLKKEGKEALEEVLSTATRPVDLLLKGTREGALGAKAAVERVFELLDEASDPLVVDSVLRYAADALKLPFDDVKARFSERRALRRKRRVQRTEKGRIPWEKDVLVRMLREAGDLPSCKERLSPESFRDPVVRSLVRKILEAKDLQELARSAEGEEMEILAAGLLRDEEEAEGEMDRIISIKAEEKRLRAEINRLKKLISSSKSEEEREGLVRLWMEKIKALKALKGGAHEPC